MAAARARMRSAPYVEPIVTGLLIAAAGTVPWVLMARMNARIRPDLPWAALATALYLAVLLAWLDGHGPPNAHAKQRRERLRLRPPALAGSADAHPFTAGAALALLGLLTVLWVVVGRMSPMPDLTAYPTTVYRWSLFIMGGVTAGVVEEAAFRGYMQSRHRAA